MQFHSCLNEIQLAVNILDQAPPVNLHILKGQEITSFLLKVVFENVSSGYESSM